ncbi:hypothetical protein S7711_10762 [Stachybotrys chartarum IBT 7711]|uniref:Uncharacterized protein n=1 Tax=Stachybotrys chartarum (strain CBS 109288 / IBT 7711) TaxID=1280523 RepID=A0A084AU62_STACB|nr:hypothetical protein S7711_10762 [Stachybotrys chartarum IBT 7711]KFA81594.1 hypothetical protein S40288_11560 [Stachybotrys chartarum IBT 40288]
MLQVSSPLAPVIAARPVTPSTPSARSPSSGITANATGTVSARPLFYFSSSTSTTQPEHQFSNPFSTNEPEQTTTRIVTETSLQSLRHLGLNTPESTPVKQGKQVVKVDEDESEEDESGILFQITDRLSTDGVRLKPSTEAYLGYLLREKTAIYEAKLLAREVTIEKLMKKMDRMSLKEF